ncbi:hypothetical protein N9A72_00735, partial [bacterium]|nr:hypothetical protein [bacterium]
MKKIIAIGLAISLVSMGIGIAYAAITSVQSSASTASAELMGTPSGDMTIAMKNISDNGAATQVSWSGVTVGSTEWKYSDQYIQIDNTYNATGWGIQIYTDNQGYTGTGDPCGLIATDDTTKKLPL